MSLFDRLTTVNASLALVAAVAIIFAVGAAPEMLGAKVGPIATGLILCFVGFAVGRSVSLIAPDSAEKSRSTLVRLEFELKEVRREIRQIGFRRES